MGVTCGQASAIRNPARDDHSDLRGWSRRGTIGTPTNLAELQFHWQPARPTHIQRGRMTAQRDCPSHSNRY